MAFPPKNTVNWISDKFGVNLVEFSHIVKYTSLADLSAQTKQFGSKPLAIGGSMLSRILHIKWEELLFPVPLGDARYNFAKIDIGLRISRYSAS